MEKMRELTEEEKKFEEYLESIGGLVNGWFSDRPPIKSRHFFSVGVGWLPLIQELIEKCIEADWDMNILQVKEKFGGLRFYIGGAPNEVHDIIEEYQNKSYETCEVCGKKGKLRSERPWMLTLCDEHNT